MIKVLRALLMMHETQRLVVARFALRKFYRKQTIAYISTQAQIQGQNSDKKVQTENPTEDLRFAKRINRIRATKLKLQSKEVRIQICLQPNFKLSKTMFKLVNQKEENETKIQALVSSNLDKRVKCYTSLKIRDKS